MKFCRICSIEKPLSDFPVRKSSKGGHRNECKSCKSIIDAKRHKERMSCPDERAKESLRLKTLHASKSEEEKARIRQRQVETARILAQKEKDKFLLDNGCTRQEAKYKLDGDAFIEDGLSRNGELYSYHAVDYRGVQTPVKIWCNKHSSFFMQTPHDHKIGRGCPECGKIATGNALRKHHQDFLTQAEDFCGDKFTFGSVVYVDNKTHIEVTCKVHGNFPITPGNLLTGKGCPSCAKYGYRNNIPGSLYVLHDGNLTKIGITNKAVSSRVRQLNSKGKGFQIISQHLFEDGKHASNLEMTLLRELRKEYLQPADKFDGSTECFFGLDPYELARDISARLPQQTEETNDYRPDHEPRKSQAPNCRCRRSCLPERQRNPDHT